MSKGVYGALVGLLFGATSGMQRNGRPASRGSVPQRMITAGLIVP